MAKKIRRTLHQVWCDREDAGEQHVDADYVWYDGKIYRVYDEHYTGEYFLQSPDDKDIVHMDVDMIHERCYEVFDSEVRTLRVLFGKKVL